MSKTQHVSQACNADELYLSESSVGAGHTETSGLARAFITIGHKTIDLPWMVSMRSNRRLLTTVWAVCLIAMSTQTGASGGQDRTKQTWQGFVTDTHCGTNCQVTKDMTPDKKCVRLCVRKGSKYGLWVEHHVYLLEPQETAARFAARDVTVTGTLHGETIHIDSLTPTNHLIAKKTRMSVSRSIGCQTYRDEGVESGTSCSQ
jgi:hypothetical protein